MSARVTDVRHGDHVLPGQQEQTFDMACHSLEAIDGSSCVVLISFVPRDGGGYYVELGIAGTGPRGFATVIAETLHEAADATARAMDRAEQRRGGGDS